MKRPSTAVAVFSPVPVTSTSAPASGVPCSPSTTRPTRRPVSCCAMSDPGASASASTEEHPTEPRHARHRSPEPMTVSGEGVPAPPFVRGQTSPDAVSDRATECNECVTKTRTPGETGGPAVSRTGKQAGWVSALRRPSRRCRGRRPWTRAARTRCRSLLMREMLAQPFRLVLVLVHEGERLQDRDGLLVQVEGAPHLPRARAAAP